MDNKIYLLAILLAIILMVVVFFVWLQYRPIQNYTAANEPVYVGSYAGAPPHFAGRMKVITWNIKYAEKIKTAITELRTVEALQGADIILLQEMDAPGVETIAQALGYNYVYYPASIHIRHNRDFGNAILSKWPLANPVKLLLPYESQLKQRRIAVRALLTLSQIELPVYCVHTETIWLGESKRLAQAERVLKDLDQKAPYILVGGDFNTATTSSINNLDERFAQAGLARVSLEAGPSIEVVGIPFFSDHIFAQGLSPIAAGVWRKSRASDHLPVWVELALEE
jgi:endonuclease/exonuclease/phosphatase family metal-dependent hydrolase